MHASSLLALLYITLLVSANTPIYGPTFAVTPKVAAEAAAPQWHFDERTCFPSDATDGKGGMHPGLHADLCNIIKINDDCPPQPPMNGPRTEASPVPTYWEVVHCVHDNSWRILYDLYFPKDTGHRHDWEWAIVRWVDDGTGTKMWKRAGMFFEHEGDISYTAWDDIYSTYNNDTDVAADGVKGKDHAKLYVAKFHHSVWDTMYTAAFANTCPPNAACDYRSDDYRWEAAKMLVHGSVIDPDWDYGRAHSSPPSFRRGRRHDMCRFGM